MSFGSKVFEERNFVKEFITIIIDLYENRKWNSKKPSDCSKVEAYVNYLLTEEHKKKITELMMNYKGFPATLFFLVISKHLTPGLCLHGLLRNCPICNIDHHNFRNMGPNPVYDPDIEKIISQYNN